MARIELVEVAKTFSTRSGDVQALASVSLEVADAEFVTIVGASGCGKSTLLNLVAGFEPLSFGKVLSDGEPINGPGPDRGVVFQQTALFPWLTVAKNIGFGLKLKANAGKAPVELTVETLLRRTGLSKFRDRFPAELSGGMRQRALSLLCFERHCQRHARHHNSVDPGHEFWIKGTYFADLQP